MSKSRTFTHACPGSLAAHSSIYPELRIRERELTAKGYNQMVIGVSENAGKDGEDYSPKAPTHYVARKKGIRGGDGEAEPKERALVHVRNTVTLCTQTNVLSQGKGSTVPVLELKKIGAADAPDFRAAGAYNLTDNTRFYLCGSPLEYN